MKFHRILKINKISMLVIIILLCLVCLYSNHEYFFQKSMFIMFYRANSDVNDYKSDIKLSSIDLTEVSMKLLLKTVELLPLSLVSNDAVNKSLVQSIYSDFNLFLIFTKENYQLHKKFDLFIRSLLKFSSVKIHLHIITDKSSELSVEHLLQQQVQKFQQPIFYSLYDISLCSQRILDIANAMKPYFSASKSSYYSDTLFFLSLGLHRIADTKITRAVLVDCDVVFRSDVRLLFEEFDKFTESNLFGLGPELTPVYRHILYHYRSNYPDSNLGNPYYPFSVKRIIQHKEKQKRQTTHGYPGLNSGVILLYLSRIRESKMYNNNIMEPQLRSMITKYAFNGHLGDQDFFTLLGFEFPKLIYKLDCVWNRQLCTWWKDHGYSDIFDAYFHCEGKIKIYHGNCNTRVPE